MDAPNPELQRYWAARAEYRIPSEPALADFCIVMLKWKSIFLAVLGACVLLAVAIGFIQPRFYESRAVIEVGQLGFNEPLLEPVESVVERLKEYYRVGDASEGQINPPFLSEVRVSKQAKSFLVLTAVGRQSHEARGFLQTVMDHLLKEHEMLKQKATLASRMQVQLVEKQIDRFASDIQVLDRRVQQAVQQGMTAGAMVLSVDKNRLVEQVSELEQQRVRISAKIAEAESRSTRAVRGPTLPLIPAGSPIWLYILVGLVAGLATGIVVILAVEFFQTLRRQQALLTHSH